MEPLFFTLLNRSITAGWLIVAVILIRFLLKKAPKNMRCILWGLAGIRLICPFSFKSVMSLIPSAETISSDIMYSHSPTIHSGITAVNNTINPILSSSFAPAPEASANPLQIWGTAASIIWITGIIILILYTVISLLLLHRKIRESIVLYDNILLCDHIDTPFILGIIRPRIFLPSSIKETQMEYIISHEKAHLSRKDHLWKSLGFVLLIIYWFQPLCFLAWKMLCKDIELACDEKVIQNFDLQQKKEYSKTLLSCSIRRKTFSFIAYPLAFGKVGVTERILAIMNYKKPAFWMTITAIITCIAVVLCFLTDPKTAAAVDYHSSETYETDSSYVSADNSNETTPARQLSFRILTLNDVVTLSQKGEDLVWEDFEKYAYTETGSGLYIRLYEINSVFSLWIGGGTPSGKPMYIHLRANSKGTAENTSEDAAENNFIDIRTEDVYGFISMYQQELLDDAISAAILAHNRPHHSANLLSVESHIVLDSNSSGSFDHKQQTGTKTATVYLWTLYEAYKLYDNELSSEYGISVPAVLTFQIENWNYTLTEYWEPRDGSYYADDIKNKFPSSCQEEALDSQKYINELMEVCYEDALSLALENISVDNQIEAILNNIVSSPSYSSNPNDYIEEHFSFYQKLFAYREDTIRYCFSEFLEGSQTDLRGHIMARVCRDIIESWGETIPNQFDTEKNNSSNITEDSYSTGQEWFDHFLEHTKNLEKQIASEELQKYFPAEWLLLQME